MRRADSRLEVGHRGPNLDFFVARPARTGGRRNSGWRRRFAKDPLRHLPSGDPLDRAKLAGRIGALSPEVLSQVEEGLKAALDLD